MTVHKEFMTHDVTTPVADLFMCKRCKSIYRTTKKNPKCPTNHILCLGAIQVATARRVG